MAEVTEITHELDALSSLRDSFALHLSATRAEKTARIYLAALNAHIQNLGFKSILVPWHSAYYGW